MLHHFILDITLFLFAGEPHPALPETIFSSLFDVGAALHRLYCLHVEIPVVLFGLVAALLELVNRVLDKLFVVKFAMGLGPGEFAGVVLGLEVAVALGSAESEYFAVVSDEGGPVTRVDGTGTDVAPLNSHQQSI